MATIVILLLVLGAIAAILYAWRLPPFGGRYEQTDDAYVRGQTTVISPQVSGYVSQVAGQRLPGCPAGSGPRPDRRQHLQREGGAGATRTC
jgi:hypothetical protein